MVAGTLEAPSAERVVERVLESRPDPDRRRVGGAPRRRSPSRAAPGRGRRRSSSSRAIWRCCCAPARASTTRSISCRRARTRADARRRRRAARSRARRPEFRRGAGRAAGRVPAALCRARRVWASRRRRCPTVLEAIAGGGRARRGAAAQDHRRLALSRLPVPVAPAACWCSSSRSCCRNSRACSAISTPSRTRCWRRSCKSPPACARTALIYAGAAGVAVLALTLALAQRRARARP